MDKTVRMGLLFDFYGTLLTDHQQKIIQLYFHDDLSFGEIAEELNVSRQAIYDIVQRAASILEDFETKLKLVERHQEREVLLTELLELVEASKLDPTLLPHLEEKIRHALVSN